MDSRQQTVLDRIQAVMPEASFDLPATSEMIARAEQALAVPFPEWLRTIYLACNGFRGPTAVRYLYPLDGRDGAVEFTLFLRSEWSLPWLDRTIVFSDNGIGGSSTVHWAICDGKLIEWCYGDGGEYTLADGDLFDLLAREQSLWDDIDANPA